MHRLLHMSIAGFLILGALHAVADEAIRLANGVVIKGEMQASSKDGLTVKTPKGVKTYTWETLSPATRYRFQPIFRANYSQVLDGLPPSSRVNEPDPELVEEVSGNAAKEQKAEQNKKKVTKPSQSLHLEDQIVYENTKPFSTQEFPGLDLRTPETAAFWGLQYGPDSEDVLYVAFDARSVEDIRDTMFVYAPKSKKYKQTQKGKALKKKSGSRYTARFKEIEFFGKFGEIDAEFEIEFIYTTGEARDLSVTIDVALSGRNEESCFILHSQPTDLIYENGAISIRGILDLPILWVSLDPTSVKPRLIGDLRMSRMTLCPKRGMDTSVNIEILKEAGHKFVEKQSIKLNEDMFERDYGIAYDLKKADQGEKYIARAEINLGAFLGKASCEETIFIPKKPGN